MKQCMLQRVMTALITTVTVVILVSAMCSLLEAVLYAVPASQVEQLAEEGGRGGKLLKRLRAQVDRPITAILSLNTIANTAGAAVAGALAAEAFGEAALPVFSGVFTILILLFSEVMPKTIGVVHARRLAAVIALPLYGLVWLFRPIIYVIGLVTRVFAGAGEGPKMSKEEIASLARVGWRSGVIDEAQATAIENIVTMQAKQVQAILTPRTVLFALPEAMSCQEAAKLEKVFVHSRIPIYGAGPDDITGIVLRRDILASVAADHHLVPVGKLSQPAEFIREDATLGQALKRFLATKRHMLIVHNEFGALEGVVTLEDVIEEMLGREIVDESDKITDMRDFAFAQAKNHLEPPSK